MATHRSKAVTRFLWSVMCVLLGVLFSAISAWFMAFVTLYAATFLAWRGWRIRAKGIRLELENEWWSRAREGVEQEPLDPCCVLFGDNGYRHDEATCTRYRYKKPKPITREERIDIDKAWNEIIAHLEDPEYGEEA